MWGISRQRLKESNSVKGSNTRIRVQKHAAHISETLNSECAHLNHLKLQFRYAFRCLCLSVTVSLTSHCSSPVYSLFRSLEYWPARLTAQASSYNKNKNNRNNTRTSLWVSFAIYHAQVYIRSGREKMYHCTSVVLNAKTCKNSLTTLNTPRKLQKTQQKLDKALTWQKPTNSS